MTETKFNRAIAIIDKRNSEDPHIDSFQGSQVPKELLYSRRMSKKLLEFKPDASEALQLAARAQHICRWKIARNEYSLDKAGYIKWRETLKMMHAEITGDILMEVGYDSEFIKRVSFLIQKKSMKKDEGAQVLEDVVCLVFLDYYFEYFSAKHPDEKVIDILRKTWKKMSEKGRSEALDLQLSPKSAGLIRKAVENKQ
jgi:hypothetical protein